MGMEERMQIDDDYCGIENKNFNENKIFASKDSVPRSCCAKNCMALKCGAWVASTRRIKQVMIDNRRGSNEPVKKRKRENQENQNRSFYWVRFMWSKIKQIACEPERVRLTWVR